jgi:BirA family transcriptional regulator, biotin operon repressor / biotin---[acetyl-CoA-carboxylase] ligase
MSVVCRPTDEESGAVLSLRVGLATADLLERYVGGSIRLKWPNDLMLADRKLGGILCEARWQGGSLGWVAVGLGLNVSNPIPDDLRAVATSLREEGSAVEADELAELLAAAIGQLSALTGGLDPGELARFDRRDWLAGRALVEPAVGAAAGVDAAGQLLVRAPDRSVIPCRSGHVVLG